MIGRVCTGSNVFSLAVLMVEGLTYIKTDAQFGNWVDPDPSKEAWTKPRIN